MKKFLLKILFLIGMPIAGLVIGFTSWWKYYVSGDEDSQEMWDSISIFKKGKEE